MALTSGPGWSRSLSTAEIREDRSHLLPLLSSRALKPSLLEDRVNAAVVSGGKEEEEAEEEMCCLSSSEKFLPNSFLFDLRGGKSRKVPSYILLMVYQALSNCLKASSLSF